MRKLAGLIILVVLAGLLAGCSKTYIKGLEPQSHFDFPNSNVTPVGKAVGSASSTKFMGNPLVTSGMIDDAVNEALQSQGGDVLINYVATETYSSFLFFNTVTYSVDGTVCKAEIGTQKLN